VLPAGSPDGARVRTVALDLVRTDVRVWAMVRAGTEAWPATAAVIRHLATVTPSA
jgi:hypothetical protein